ncbi:hypothetical protein Xen7305DRAFT_00051150 [Xenococcus sp. PCC 7305]|uniref:beta-carboxysome assembly chaperone CcmS n=1 Tax=Xenococcus sp. PCC 7305 TaxID=102125 RepID=UPI0002ABD26A|nr:hypothetical protein [Xenococcus sp. PCC 7305]ELS05372.1 hypothetical protein Xen7305DRAFT_00051150 [Xenococcus sp. PCC 7305]
MQFGSSQKNIPEEKWRWQLDNFVDDHEQKLAALAWGLQQEWEKPDDILGIDIKPQPHFVACTKESLEKLNKRTKGHIQEILGLIDGYQREQEVLILAIGDGQVKLLHFQPQTSPPECFLAENKDIDGLITFLESALALNIEH